MSVNSYDWVIVGSGFGGSVSALRLAEKGYRVAVLEKGKRFETHDFAKNNNDLKRWLWQPALRAHGIFQMSFLRHVTVLHGVGLGGGSLTYANTLPKPKSAFFESPAWGHLADWEPELEPHYATVRRMLGAAANPEETPGDRVLAEIARQIGRTEHQHPTEVAVFFGDPGVEAEDPYFDGEGPRRVGCTHCGSCMTGCRVGAKNTLDRNYLYLAEKLGVDIHTETEVVAVRPRHGETGYVVETEPSIGKRPPQTFTATNVVFAGGVMGTVRLLLAMKEDPAGLPQISDRLGHLVRTNNESLIGVIAPESKEDFSRGVAITSILHTDEHSHLEPVRYGRGSSFYQKLMLPHAPASNVLVRLAGSLRAFLRRPRPYLRSWWMRDFAERTQILLYMRTLEETLTLRFSRSPFTGFRKGLVSSVDDPTKAPTANLPEATKLANLFADIVDGVPANLVTETIVAAPTTAHVLGGCAMGANPQEGVVDSDHRVFGYPGLYVIDGSAVSANPGVNPSLTIAALAERAMTKVPTAT